MFGGPNYAAQNAAPNGIYGLQDRGKPTFGVDLALQMARDNAEVPPIVLKCSQAIEKYGMNSQGVYRVSGMTSKVLNLKQRLDKGWRSHPCSGAPTNANSQTSTPSIWILPNGRVTLTRFAAC